MLFIATPIALRSQVPRSSFATTATMSGNASGTSTTNLALFERNDIHKSCKALELVVNLFNDYCQAAEAMSAMQKKLAKALKDAAACKGTGELVGALYRLISVVVCNAEVLWTCDSQWVNNSGFGVRVAVGS